MHTRGVSKAFTRETDDAPDDSARPRRVSAAPSGVRNYTTPDGLRRWREEKADLLEIQRPAAQALADAPERQACVRRLDERLAWLESCLATAVETPPPSEQDTVRFGAFVRVRSSVGEDTEFRIVGVDEADPNRDWVSWLSPLARALMNRRMGDEITLKLPGGLERLQLLRVRYEP